MAPRPKGAENHHNKRKKRMVKVTFVAADGGTRDIQGEIGDSVMSLALANGFDAVLGECGGSMMCATCHCYVDAAWADQAGARMDGEEDMLDCAAAPVTDLSRLSCQIKLNPELDGLIVHLPADQV
jgi:2Fe-2S ferredoxin